MPPPAQSRFWRRLRLAFRGFRITVLLFILALLGGLIYLNRSGLPDFAKRPLLENLRARGIDLEMSRFYRGLVAEDVKFGRAETADSPRFTARNLEVKINYLALAKRQLQVTAVVLNQGRLTWPVADTNTPPRAFVVENIRARLRLLPGDEWALDHFHAMFAGADFTLSGTVTNASAIRDWPFLQGKQPAGVALRRLRRFAETLENIHFATPPDLRLMIDGDARDLQSFTVHLSLNAPAADTPWGKVTRGVFTARLFPAANNAPGHANLSLQAEDAQTPWAAVAGLDLEVHLVSPAGQTNDVDASLTAKAARAQTQWAGVTNVQFTANWIHSLTNAIPLSGRGELRADNAASRWVGGKELRFTATLATPTNPPPADAAWGWWTNLQPFHLDWAGELSQLDTEKLAAEKVACAGRWRPPELTVTNLHADFADGRLDARAQLDVATREARFDLTSNFDVQQVSPLLTAKSRRWLEKFSWRNPPVLAGHGAVVLPAWTNRQPDWRGEVQPTLRLGGQFAVTNGAYLGVPADWARSHFSYSNRVWHLPDLEAGRPEGAVRLVHIANDGTKDYYWRVHSTIDVRALRPLLATNQQRGLDLVAFTQPPVIDGEVWGRLYKHERIGFQGHVTMTNFTFREQTASFVESSVRYTNRFLELIDPRLLRGTQT
ncbi:MAG: AsmA 2 domain-containing protein, partial [Deltaproteobacteria bacterium]|nr:AsmA 2 domain-containing protein [Deltaproteobacteria bacterium]